MLVSLLEAKPWLATGHARTANARIRTRKAWSDIATTLNCDGSGCVKSSDQWCKYWKDKKGAVKRKSSQIIIARRRTGGGVDNVPELSNTELKILNMMGGESFASGDQHFEINPFQEQEVINRDVQIEESPSILENIANDSAQTLQPATEHYQVEWDLSNIAVAGEEIRLTERSPPVIVGHTSQEQNLVTEGEAPHTPQQLPVDVQIGSETPTLSQSQRRTPQSRRRARQCPRGTAARRRLLRRSPPSQRRSEMVSLTERFIAIEERRAEAEAMIARAISLHAENELTTARAINRLVDVLIDYLNK